jgi:hypothetical protein
MYNDMYNERLDKIGLSLKQKKDDGPIDKEFFFFSNFRCIVYILFI